MRNGNKKVTGIFKIYYFAITKILVFSLNYGLILQITGFLIFKDKFKYKKRETKEDFINILKEKKDLFIHISVDQFYVQ